LDSQGKKDATIMRLASRAGQGDNSSLSAAASKMKKPGQTAGLKQIARSAVN
jgi:hypothetical protein